jgi:hypothetical protein
MSAKNSRISTRILEADSTENMAEEYISVSEALKLVSPFSGNKREVVTFISNVDTAFEVVNPDHQGRLYKFVLTRISGEPRTAIAHRHLDNWIELREFLRNTYIEKRTLDFHATQLFKARQGKSDNVSEWIQQVQSLGSKFRESALTDCTVEERPGILTLSDRLRNICFVQGLVSDRIQTIVRSRNQDDFDEIAETALEEESAINSKLERYKVPDGKSPIQCSNCKKLGHSSSRCYLKGKVENRINQYSIKRRPIKEIVCYNCGMKGHVAKDCRNQKGRKPNYKETEKGISGNGDRLPAHSQQTTSTVQ